MGGPSVKRVEGGRTVIRNITWHVLSNADRLMSALLATAIMSVLCRGVASELQGGSNLRDILAAQAGNECHT